MYNNTTHDYALRRIINKFPLAVLNFLTAFYVEGNLVTSHAAIARHYLGFWFWLDTMSSLPYGWMLSDNENRAEVEVTTRVNTMYYICCNSGCMTYFHCAT